MTVFKRGEKVEVAVHKDTHGRLNRLSIDVRDPKDWLKEYGNFWILSEIIDEPGYYDPSDNTYQVKDVRDIYNGVYFWAKEQYIRRPGGDHDGINCDLCGEFYRMAEPNFMSTKLICFRCVDSNGWKYKKDKVSGLVTLR